MIRYILIPFLILMFMLGFAIQRTWSVWQRKQLVAIGEGNNIITDVNPDMIVGGMNEKAN